MDNEITPVCLPAHATHLLQPLDVGIFRPYQHYYNQEVAIKANAKIFGINKKAFLAMIQVARSCAFSAENIEGAWRGTGLIPFNRDLVLTKLENFLVSKAREIANRNGRARQHTPVDYKLPPEITTPTNRQEREIIARAIISKGLATPDHNRYVEALTHAIERAEASLLIKETHAQIIEAQNSQRKHKKKGDRRRLIDGHVISGAIAEQLVQQQIEKEEIVAIRTSQREEKRQAKLLISQRQLAISSDEEDKEENTEDEDNDRTDTSSESGSETNSNIGKALRQSIQPVAQSRSVSVLASRFFLKEIVIPASQPIIEVDEDSSDLESITYN